jgi:hypothetical protein
MSTSKPMPRLITVRLMWDGKIPPALQLKYGEERCVVNTNDKTVSVVIDNSELSDAMDFLSSSGVEMARPIQLIPSISELHELVVNASDIVHVKKALSCEGEYVWLQREKCLASLIVGVTIKLDLALLVQSEVPFSLVACREA